MVSFDREFNADHNEVTYHILIVNIEHDTMVQWQ